MSCGGDRCPYCRKCRSNDSEDDSDLCSLESNDDEAKDDQSIASCCTPTEDEAAINVSEDAQAQQNSSNEALADYKGNLQTNKNWNLNSPKTILPNSQSKSMYVGMQLVAQTQNLLSNQQQAIPSRSLCSCLRSASQSKNLHAEIQTAFPSKSQPIIFHPQPQSNILCAEIKLASRVNHPNPEVQLASHFKNIKPENKFTSELKNLKAIIQPELQSKNINTPSQLKSLKAVVQPELQSKNLKITAQQKDLKAVVQPELKSKDITVIAQVKYVKAVVEPELQPQNFKVTSQLKNLKPAVQSELQSMVPHSGKQVTSESDNKHTDARADALVKIPNADSKTTSQPQSLDAAMPLGPSLAANMKTNMQQLSPTKRLQTDFQERPLTQLTKDTHSNMKQTSLARSMESDVQPSIQTQIMDAAAQQATLMKHMQTYMQLSSLPKKQQTEQHLESPTKSLNADRPTELHSNNFQPAFSETILPGMQPQMKCFQTDRQPASQFTCVRNNMQPVDGFQQILSESAQRQCHLMAEHNDIIKEQCRLNTENNALQAEIVKALNNSVRVASLLNTTMINLSVANGSFCEQMLGTQQTYSQNWHDLASAFEGPESQDISASGLTSEISTSDSDISPSSSEERRIVPIQKRASSERRSPSKRKK